MLTPTLPDERCPLWCFQCGEKFMVPLEYLRHSQRLRKYCPACERRRSDQRSSAFLVRLPKLSPELRQNAQRSYREVSRFLQLPVDVVRYTERRSLQKLRAHPDAPAVIEALAGLPSAPAPPDVVAVLRRQLRRWQQEADWMEQSGAAEEAAEMRTALAELEAAVTKYEQTETQTS